MSIKSHAAHADTVKDEFVKQTCPKQVEALQLLLDNAELGWDDLGISNEIDDLKEGLSEFEEDENAIESIINSYNRLQKAFYRATGLDLKIKFWDEDCEGQIEEGFYWEVEGVYGLTPAGIANQGNFERQFWTTFG